MRIQSFARIQDALSSKIDAIHTNRFEHSLSAVGRRGLVERDLDAHLVETKEPEEMEEKPSIVRF